jgi:hypothetical protein
LEAFDLSVDQAGFTVLFARNVEPHRVGFENRRDLRCFLEGGRCHNKPVESAKCPVKFAKQSVELIAELSGGYPYFIQFICREVYDIWIQQVAAGRKQTSVPTEEITRKLDTDFFAGRWGRATDRQRELMYVISTLPTCDGEFSVQEIVEASAALLDTGFGNSHVNQMLGTLANAGLVYKNRRGKYSFAVPLMAGFIRRQSEE